MSDRTVCKPSPWFIFRAIAMLAMFSIFAVLFFVDAKWGYREKNLAYYTHKAFGDAMDAFSKGSYDAESWKMLAAHQNVNLGDDPNLLPEGVKQPMPWPKQLLDFDRVKAAQGNWRPLYDEYRLEAGIKREPDEHLFDKQKILEQWIVCVLSSILAVGTLFVTIRTLGRRLAIDDTTLYPPAGGAVPVADLVRLDLRKWDTKGVAFTWARTSGDALRKIRLDGFVYGGFKKEQGEPAEAFMRRLKASFSGEILQYVAEQPAAAEVSAPEA